jgi:hypothetical protein
MSRKSERPTLALRNRICAFIRAGSFPHVAAQAEGITPEEFEDWLRRGRQRRAAGEYRQFAQAVDQAVAQARLRAETAVLADNPMNWLKHGPGKQSPQSPGWTNQVRPPAPSDKDSTKALLEPELAALLSRILAALVPFPEAKAAVAAAIGAGEQGGPSSED